MLAFPGSISRPFTAHPPTRDELAFDLGRSTHCTLRASTPRRSTDAEACFLMQQPAPMEVSPPPAALPMPQPPLLPPPPPQPIAPPEARPPNVSLRALHPSWLVVCAHLCVLSCALRF